MPKKKPDKYDMSTDYQLPPGELWWLLEFWTTRELIAILFTMPEQAKTWYEANQQAELLVRDELNGADKKMPKYTVTLWNPPKENAIRTLGKALGYL